MRTAKILAILILSAQLTACASITAGTTQSISVDTVPRKNADCNLKNDKGNWNVTAPGSTTVTKAYGALTVTCHAKGGWAGSTSVASTTAGASFGNILVGGVIGAGVDMASGAAYVYPSSVLVNLTK